MTRYNTGWRGESSRHSLSRRGIKTGKACSTNYSMFNKSKSPHDHVLLSAGTKNEVHHNLLTLLETKKVENPEHAAQIEKAQEEVKYITTLGKLKEWFHRHRHALELVGITALLFGLSQLSGGAGQMMMNVHTGEIVRMGGSTLGLAANYGAVVVGGFGLGETLREGLIASEEETLEKKMKSTTSHKDFDRMKKEQEVLEDSEKIFGRKSEEVPVFEEALEAKGRKIK
jgi:hypothetical protein